MVNFFRNSFRGYPSSGQKSVTLMLLVKFINRVLLSYVTLWSIIFLLLLMDEGRSMYAAGGGVWVSVCWAGDGKRLTPRDRGLKSLSVFRPG